jgi:uncharacterized membrane protein
VRGLGWFSLGLGATALALPDRLARAIGVRGDLRTQSVLRLIGLRNTGSGIGILASRWPAGWLWWRVAGDAMDLTLMSRVLSSETTSAGWAQSLPGMGWTRSLRRAQGEDPERAKGALLALLAITVLDVWCALRLSRARRSTATLPAGRHEAQQGGITVKQAITIKRPSAELYRYWRDFTNLPRIMRHLEAVQVNGERRSHWRAKAPAGQTVEWDAEITEDRPNDVIAWRSLPGASVPNTGSVRFIPAPGDRGTEIHISLRYDPPGGKLAALVAKLFGEEPRQQMSDDLRRFKQLMETGEITRSDASIWGQGLLQHPAQPPKKVPAELARR